MPVNTANHGTSPGAPDTHVGHVGILPGFGLWPGPALAIVVIWEVTLCFPTFFLLKIKQNM